MADQRRCARPAAARRSTIRSAKSHGRPEPVVAARDQQHLAGDPLDRDPGGRHPVGVRLEALLVHAHELRPGRCPAPTSSSYGTNEQRLAPAGPRRPLRPLRARAPPTRRTAPRPRPPRRSRGAATPSSSAASRALATSPARPAARTARAASPSGSSKDSSGTRSIVSPNQRYDAAVAPRPARTRQRSSSTRPLEPGTGRSTPGRAVRPSDDTPVRSSAGRASSRADVDPPAGQPGREAGVLALLADGQGQLEVGDDDARRAGLERRPPRPR